MKKALHIGHEACETLIETTASVLLRIMEARADQETIRAAIYALEKVTSISNVSISDTVINMNEAGTPK